MLETIFGYVALWILLIFFSVIMFLIQNWGRLLTPKEVKVCEEHGEAENNNYSHCAFCGEILRTKTKEPVLPALKTSYEKIDSQEYNVKKEAWKEVIEEDESISNNTEERKKINVETQ